MTVTIKNVGSDVVKVQVRIGDQEPAEANADLRNYDLMANASTGPLDFDVFLFYRIANNPASPASWSDWNQIFTDIESVITV